jgi:hypothetical protein
LRIRNQTLDDIDSSRPVVSSIGLVSLACCLSVPGQAVYTASSFFILMLAVGIKCELDICETSLKAYSLRLELCYQLNGLSALCFDEMAIETALNYDSGLDVIDGFED